MFPSSEPVTRYGSPRREGQQLLTNEVWPFSFLILSPTSQSHTEPVLSTEQENSILREVGEMALKNAHFL